MSKVYFLWFGGPSYAVPSADDLETADSLADVLSIMRARERYWDGRTPCVEDQGAHVFLSDPRNGSDWYPDRVVSAGPRGGLRMERC